MKHLPNELLYLLKVYNYITIDIGLDHARSRADDIRAYIAGADFLNAYPTVKEYLSEDKSIDDIITYIQRNRRTYELMQDWNTREMSNHLASKGIDGSAIGFVGSVTVYKDERNAYFLLPDKDPCRLLKVLLIDADIAEDITTETVLWLEFYKKDDKYFLEIFDDSLSTYRICFTDFKKEYIFLSASCLAKAAKNKADAIMKMASHIFKKYSYDSSLLTEAEAKLLPYIHFLAEVKDLKYSKECPEMTALFREHGIKKGEEILSKLVLAQTEKKTQSLCKKLISLLKSRKCAPIADRLYDAILASQKEL